ncbi:hypothetical protein BJ170DRAFT_175133 [Xylariales sp. AK1849]|nr:hypothetical protein BJ170DRAFT_175133 [Xylariales sp. AK1849]
MRMDSLPSEILEHIIFYLVPEHRFWHPKRDVSQGERADSIAAYAVISRQWQASIERLNFAHLCLTTARLASNSAKRTLTTSRLKLVRFIDLEVVLEFYGFPEQFLAETDSEKRRNNEVFTRTVAALFALLKPLDGKDMSRKVLRLVAYSPADPDRRPGRRLERNDHWVRDKLETRYEQSYLELTWDELPTLSMISVFHVPAPYQKYRFISPGACCMIATKFNSLELITWFLSDNERKNLSLRRRLRDVFAKSIPDLPSSLQRIELFYRHKLSAPPSNPREDDVGTISVVPDPLSVALRGLCQRLRSVRIHAALTSDFFWPSYATPSQPHWPQLTALELVVVDPALLLGRRAMHDSESKPHVTAKLPVVIDWFLAIGRAATQMPKLRDLFLGGGLDGRKWGISYFTSQNCVFVECIPNFDLTRQVLDTWNRAAQVHGGAEIEVDFVDKFWDARKAVPWSPRPFYYNHSSSTTQ